MKFAIVQFPGSNCDQDCHHALGRVLGQPVRTLWHKDTSIEPDEAIILPGGFSYGDYLRAGAIAKQSPVMKAVVRAAQNGQIVVGICNGFQVLCESGLLPGALVRNNGLAFRCEYRYIRAETIHSIFTRNIRTGSILRIPIAHGEGRYIADESTLHGLQDNNQILFRYVDDFGNATAAANPNGSLLNIAGIRNKAGNVMGMMPHPERACEPALGSSDGLAIFQSILNTTGIFNPQQ